MSMTSRSCTSARGDTWRGVTRGEGVSRGGTCDRAGGGGGGDGGGTDGGGGGVRLLRRAWRLFVESIAALSHFASSTATSAADTRASATAYFTAARMCASTEKRSIVE